MHASALFGSYSGDLEPHTNPVKESFFGKTDLGEDSLVTALSSNLS